MGQGGEQWEGVSETQHAALGLAPCCSFSVFLFFSFGGLFVWLFLLLLILLRLADQCLQVRLLSGTFIAMSPSSSAESTRSTNIYLGRNWH